MGNSQEKYKEYKREWYLKNKDRCLKNAKKRYLENIENIKSYKKNYTEKNNEKLKKYKRDYYLLNKNIILVKQKKYYLDNIKKNYDARKQRKPHPGSLIARRLRTRVNHALRGINSVGGLTDILGCALDELILYLESRFQEGMSWDNYGRTGWHIDHIRPCASFDLSDPKQQKHCKYLCEPIPN